MAFVSIDRLHRCLCATGPMDTSAAIIDLLYRANSHGEIEVSIRTLAEDWEWSRSRVSRYLDLLRKQGFLETHSGTHRGTLPQKLTLSIYRELTKPTGKVETHNGTQGGTQEKVFPKNPPKPTPKNHECPENFEITIKMKAWANEKTPRVLDLENQTERFVNWHRGKGTLNKRWEQAWRNWMLNQEKYNAERPDSGAGKQTRGNTSERRARLAEAVARRK